MSCRRFWACACRREPVGARHDREAFTCRTSRRSNLVWGADLSGRGGNREHRPARNTVDVAESIRPHSEPGETCAHRRTRPPNLSGEPARSVPVIAPSGQWPCGLAPVFLTIPCGALHSHAVRPRMRAAQGPTRPDHGAFCSLYWCAKGPRQCRHARHVTLSTIPVEARPHVARHLCR